MLLFLWNFFSTMRKEKDAPADPWDGRTLEWSIPSPPPHYNFATIPTVHGRDAFWDQKYVEDAEGRPRPVPAGGAVAQSEHQEGEEEHHDIHMPGPSYFPIVVALGMATTATGFLIHPLVIALGTLVTFFGIYGWAFEPADPEE